MRIINGFTFYDFCQSCQKIAKYGITGDNSSAFGVCESCGLQQPLTDLHEIFYKKTDLWVTKFKMGNISNVVTGQLLHVLRS